MLLLDVGGDTVLLVLKAFFTCFTSFKRLKFCNYHCSFITKSKINILTLLWVRTNPRCLVAHNPVRNASSNGINGVLKIF